MKPIVEFKDWTPQPEVNELLEAELDRIQRLVRGLRTESLVLRVVVDRNETRTLFRVTIRMELPGPDVSASEERHDLNEAVHDAFAEIRRQVEKHRRKMTHTFEYKRPARRDRLRRLRAGVEPVKQKETDQ
jgi:ribosomal subunit interface protein